MHNSTGGNRDWASGKQKKDTKGKPWAPKATSHWAHLSAAWASVVLICEGGILSGLAPPNSCPPIYQQQHLCAENVPLSPGKTQTKGDHHGFSPYRAWKVEDDSHLEQQLRCPHSPAECLGSIPGSEFSFQLLRRHQEWLKELYSYSLNWVLSS